MNKNRWIFIITILAFCITIVFSLISSIILSDLGLIFGILVIFVFIFLGVLFDMIGISVASCSIKPFYAIASKRIKSAKVSIDLINNSAKVSSFCNDVIGDICNIISGSAGIVVSTDIANKYNFNSSITILIITSLIAAFTIGGKAYGKDIAINNNEKIVNKFSKIISIVRRK